MLASRISYVGDLGWELYVPIARRRSGSGTPVWEAGQPRRPRARGYRRVRDDRPPRGRAYRAFGAELDADYNVVEADMAWWKVKDEDFVGKEAHVAHRAAEPGPRCCAR